MLNFLTRFIPFLVLLVLVAAAVGAALGLHRPRRSLSEWREDRRTGKRIIEERNAALAEVKRTRALLNEIREQAWLYREIEPVLSGTIIGKVADYQREIT